MRGMASGGRRVDAGHHQHGNPGEKRQRSTRRASGRSGGSSVVDDAPRFSKTPKSRPVLFRTGGFAGSRRDGAVHEEHAAANGRAQDVARRRRT